MDRSDAELHVDHGQGPPARSRRVAVQLALLRHVQPHRRRLHPHSLRLRRA